MGSLGAVDTVRRYIGEMQSGEGESVEGFAIRMYEMQMEIYSAYAGRDLDVPWGHIKKEYQDGWLKKARKKMRKTKRLVLMAMHGPRRQKKSMTSRIWKWMKGSAQDGGTISADLALDFGIPLRLASAHLSSMANYGWLKRVGKQKMTTDQIGWKTSYTIFVRRDEIDIYQGK